jgi:hypothetical protein
VKVRVIATFFLASVSIGILHRPPAVLKKANHPVKGTGAEAGPGASEAILSCWENKAGNGSKHGKSPKAGRTYGVGCPVRPRTEQRIVAFQLIEAFPKEADETIREDRRL